MRHIITFLLVIFLFIAPVYGCNKIDTDADTTTAAKEETLTLVHEGKLRYTIVRPDNASSDVIKATSKIASKIASLTGISPEVTTDFKKPDEKYDSNSYQIIVGRCAQKESVEALSQISYGESSIRISGRKIIITAWADNALRFSADKFCDILSARYSSDASIPLSADDNFTGVNYKILTNMPKFKDGNLDIVTSCGNDAYMAVLSSTDEKKYADYQKLLTDSGFKQEATNEIKGNIFSTYSKGDYALVVNYSMFNKTTRIIIQSKALLFNEYPKEYTTVTEPKMTMIGRRFSTTSIYLEKDAGAGLMCYVMQLSDGSFIVIDGGIRGDKLYADAIYDTMKAQAPDPDKIKISAWIITHYDGDHIGGFITFSEKYGSKVTLERYIDNRPNDAVADFIAVKDLINTAYVNLKTYFPNANIVKAHTGQVYNICDAKIEILYTQEDFDTKRKTLLDVTGPAYNYVSMIFSYEIAGQRIMFLGDAQPETNDITCNMFGDYLKSDICQLAHHGVLPGGTKWVYTLIDPEVIMFTTTDALVPVYSKFEFNDHLIKNLHVKEILNAADRITTKILPYHPAAG